jgi:DNA-binding transcriptional MerR regulator
MSTDPLTDETSGSDDTLTLTLDELTERVGMSVRNIRFYTTRGLVPPPLRHGRSGLYTADHVVRLELLQELQSHGFTLAAIERYLSAIPADASPETVAMHRALLAPWSADGRDEMDRAELERRTGRTLSEADVHQLEQFAVIVPSGEGTWLVSATYLSIGIGLIDLGFPVEAAAATREIYQRHGRQMAEELSEVFRTQVRPAYEATGASHEQIRSVLERIKPLSIASIVAAYEEAVEDLRRKSAARKGR